MMWLAGSHLSLYLSQRHKVGLDTRLLVILERRSEGFQSDSRLSSHNLYSLDSFRPTLLEGGKLIFHGGLSGEFVFSVFCSFFI